MSSCMVMLFERGDGGFELLAQRRERAPKNAAERSVAQAEKRFDAAIIHFLEITESEGAAMQFGQSGEGGM